ncbi:MAG: hypothetical protein COS65_06385 [Armatimonadetes bacterium CG06_land_8_20_14_3_00_66_21]|nr:MAG: hypothetical protein COS65_06385 [Armatimonadetes bacterium CG06_land_8_20_14_3_00_66_21]
MQHWASPLGQWFPVKGETNTFWHKGDFYGPFTLTVPLLLDTRLTFGATKTEFADGYSLEVTAAEEAGKATLALSKLGHLKAKAAVPVAAGASFTLEKDGRYLWVSVGEERCLAYRDQQPLTGTRVGITSKQALDTTTLQVTRHHVRDFLFEQAPTDWTEWGTWEITNRFSCTPTWSHMSGRSDYAAALWSKYALAGDFTLEYYAGMRMSTTKAMSYPRVGDMNVTFGAEGSDLSTGYSYLVGAWDPGWTSKWTKLVRRAGTVAETDRPLVPRVRTDSGRRYIPVPYVADGRDVHGAWYYCKVRRIGNRIECYYDNELVLTYDETDPLKGHRFGLWTYDNDMVVACLKVSYQRCYAPDRLVPAPLPESSAAEADQVVLTAGCAETPALSADFEQSVGGWKPATSDRNSEVTITGSGAGSGLASLRVKNLTLGGDFGVVAPVPANLDLSRAQELRFRYRLPAGARVNAYVQALGREHFIHLSGASDSNALRQCLGSVDVKTDDEWHDARFDLAAALRALYPAAETIPLQKLTFGNLHPGYVAAGLGGNPFGCRYYLDDVCLAVAGPAERSVTWKPTAPEGKEAPALQYAVAFDRSPDTVPDKLVEGAATTAKSGALKDGLWYFHVRGKASGDKWTSTAHVPLAVSTAALSCLSMSPAPGKPWGGTPVTFQLAPAGGLNLDVTRSSLTVNGQAVPLVSPAMTYDWRARKLTFDAQRSTLAFEQGKPVSVSLAAATTAAEPAAFAWEATFDKSLDRTPPAPVTLAEQFVRDDFEEGLGGWGNLGGEKYALTVLDDSTAAAGKRSLRIVNPVLTGSWSAVPTAQPFSLGKYPLLAFDYKVTEEVCADLLFTLGGETRAVTFADVDDPYLKLGATEAIQKDDQWHHAVLNLGELTRNLSFAPNQYDVTQCYFADTGYQAAAPGAYFNVDNFTLLPAESGALGVKVKLVAHDPSGIAKFRCSWSDQPTDLPVGEVPGDQPEQVFKVEHEGLQYLHVAAQDAAGNWSEPAHYAFLIDNTPPTVAEVTPAANGALGTRTVQVKFAEAPGAALDPKSMAFSVNGNSYPLTALDTGFAPATNQLSWSWCLATGLFSEPVADGTAVKFALSAVKDFAGNASAPQDWTYTVSYAADKEPPLPPEVKCSSHESVVYDTFTRGIGNWTPYGSAYGSQVDRTFDAAKGDYVAAVQLGAGTSYGNYVHIGDYDLATHPMMSFDYKIPAGVQVFFHLYLNGAWYGVPVTGQSRTYTNLGAIPGIAPDGQWHTATVNLLDLAKATVKANAHAVKYLMLCNYGGTGSVVSFDDFHLFGPGANAAVFNWKTVDPTGIKGYSYALDASPVTIPDETPETAAPTATLGNLQPGQYYFHVRAQDGAGNWGPPVHYAYRVG